MPLVHPYSNRTPSSCVHMSTHDMRLLYASVIDVHALTFRGLFHAQEVADRRCGGAPPVGGRPLHRTIWGDSVGERAAGLRDQAEGPLCISHPVVLLSICTTHIRCVARLHPRVDLDYPLSMHTFLCCSTHCIRCRCISCTGSRSRRSQATILRGQSTGQCPQPIQHSECICRHGYYIYRTGRRLYGC